MTAPILSTENVVFADLIRYPDIEIQAEKTTFVSGDSGTGKSTLLRLFNNIHAASSGIVRYRGANVLEYDPVALRREALLAGQSVFLFDLPIRDNFREFYAYRDLAPPADGDIRRHLDLCHADFPLDADCATLSGGERQRVFLALALSFAPAVLMLDEPTSALDHDTASALFANLTGFAKERGMTIVAVTHNPPLAEAYADFTVTLPNGKTEAAE